MPGQTIGNAVEELLPKQPAWRVHEVIGVQLRSAGELFSHFHSASPFNGARWPRQIGRFTPFSFCSIRKSPPVGLDVVVLNRLNPLLIRTQATTAEHGLTEYWAHRVTWCAALPSYPRIFAWVYRHEGRRLKASPVYCTWLTRNMQMTPKSQLLSDFSVFCFIENLNIGINWMFQAWNMVITWPGACRP